MNAMLTPMNRIAPIIVIQNVRAAIVSLSCSLATRAPTSEEC